MTTGPLAADVAIVRDFNRLYTHRAGLLKRRLDRSPFTLTEARILYEIAHHPRITAAHICRKLDIDRAHLSRVLSRFKRAGLVRTMPSAEHAKHQLLTLTKKGERSFAALNDKTQAAVVDLLGDMSPGRRHQFIDAVSTVRGLLDEETSAPTSFILRPPRPGDMSWVIHRQAVVYAQEYGWDWTYEGLCAQILGDFIKHFDPDREQVWIAEMDGQVAGSIFLMRGDTPDVAKLRLLYVEKAMRGQGLGRALVAACVARAREMGYERLTLWTNSILTSARVIYEAAGFTLVHEEPHHSFGCDLVGQTWTLELTESA